MNRILGTDATPPSIFPQSTETICVLGTDATASGRLRKALDDKAFIVENQFTNFRENKDGKNIGRQLQIKETFDKPRSLPARGN